jgi:hypothetical protein
VHGRGGSGTVWRRIESNRRTCGLIEMREILEMSKVNLKNYMCSHRKENTKKDSSV